MASSLWGLRRGVVPPLPPAAAPQCQQGMQVPHQLSCRAATTHGRAPVAATIADTAAAGGPAGWQAHGWRTRQPRQPQRGEAQGHSLAHLRQQPRWTGRRIVARAEGQHVPPPPEEQHEEEGEQRCGRQQQQQLQRHQQQAKGQEREPHVQGQAREQQGQEQERSSAKELNAAICAALSADELLGLVAARLSDFSLVNAVTAFHRLGKHATRLAPAQRASVQSHPAAASLASLLEELAGDLVDLQVAQVLWAHTQLWHGSQSLLDRLFSRLERAVVVADADGLSTAVMEVDTSSQTDGRSSGSSGSSGSDSDGVSLSARGRRRRRRNVPLLQLESPSAAVMLVYALAKLQRPVPALLAQLEDALLAVPEDAGGREQAGAAAADRGGNNARGEGHIGGRYEGSNAGAGTRGPPADSSSLGAGLASLSCRSLTLLLWSLASLRALHPALLLRGTSLLRRRGLWQLSVQGIGQVMLAQEMTVAARPETAGGGRAAPGSSGGEDSDRGSSSERHAPPPASEAGAAATSTVAGPGVSSCWDQAFMDDAAAELVRRHLRQPSFRLNDADVCILARSYALAWRAALSAQEGTPEGGIGSLEVPLENRLVVRAALQRHISRSRPRSILMSLLISAAQRQAHSLDTRGVSSLAWSFASLLGPQPPAEVLDALAARAIQLEGQRRLDAQAVASLAWAYSTLRYDHPQLYESLAHATLRMLGAAAAPHRPASDDAGNNSIPAAIRPRFPPTRNSSTGGNSGEKAPLQRPEDVAGSSDDDRGRHGLAAQTVSVLVFSFASANRCGSDAQRRMMEALAERAGEVLMELTPQGLANVAWGLTVAGCYPPQLIRRWRAVAGAERRFFKPAELNQLHLVEVALRVEAPSGAGLGPLPAEAASFFDSLYQAGRLRAFAGRAWARHQEFGPRSVTDFQLQVHRTICAMGVSCQLEYNEAGGYSIDVAIPEGKIAVEVDGPVHFACNSIHLMGGTALKRRLLQRLGWQAVDVPFYEWWELATGQRQSYMRRKLQAAGLSLATQEQARQLASMHKEAHGGDDDGVGSASPDARDPVFCAPPDSQASHGDPSPSSLAQRAQRLSLLQFRQGKLSRHGLVARTGSLNAANNASISVGSDGTHTITTNDNIGGIRDNANGINNA